MFVVIKVPTDSILPVCLPTGKAGWDTYYKLKMLKDLISITAIAMSVVNEFPTCVIHTFRQAWGSKSVEVILGGFRRSDSH